MIVSYSAAFKRQIKRLSRKYPHIRSDLQPLIHQLETGEAPGDRIRDVGYAVYKARVKNSDVKRGKSGGYRVIYYLHTPDNALLVTVYSKTEQSDIEADELASIIRQEESNN